MASNLVDIKLAGHYCPEVITELLEKPDAVRVLLNVSRSQVESQQSYLLSREETVSLRQSLMHYARHPKDILTGTFPQPIKKWFYIPEQTTLVSPGLFNKFLLRYTSPTSTDRILAKVGIFSAGISELWHVVLAWIILGSCEDIAVSIACDVGVNAIHSTIEALELVQKQDIILCTAGMEAILPEVIACTTDAVVLAVPSNVSSGVGEGVVSFWSISNISTPGIGIFNINGIASACRGIQMIVALMEKNDKHSLREKAQQTLHRDSLLTMDVSDKSPEQIERFIQTYAGSKNVVLKSHRGPFDPPAVPGAKFETTDLGKSHLHLLRSPDFKPISTKTKIQIVVGGFADEHIAREMLFYFNVLFKGSVAMMPFQTMSQLLKHLPEELLEADIVVVVAGSSGTLPNFISGLLYGKLVLAVPCSEQALISMVNGCVFGVPVVGTRSVAFNTVVFVLSIVNKCR